MKSVAELATSAREEIFNNVHPATFLGRLTGSGLAEAGTGPREASPVHLLPN